MEVLDNCPFFLFVLPLRIMRHLNFGQVLLSDQKKKKGHISYQMRLILLASPSSNSPPLLFKEGKCWPAKHLETRAELERLGMQ